MSTNTFELSWVLAILPEILIVVLAVVVLGLDLVLPEEKRRSLGWVTAAGLGLTLLIGAAVSRPGAEARLIWGGMLRQDWLSFTFMMLFLFSAAVTALFAMDYDRLGRRGEFYILLMVSTIGMILMAASADLIMLYLAIETTSIPLYALAGFMTKDDKSSEAGFKYLLFGAMTSAVMLYGFSLLYGFSGTTGIYSLLLGMKAGTLPTAAIIGSMLLVLVGFGFKISVVPFQFWAPDVYEGAPTPVAGFLSTASKAAGFAVLLRFLMVVYPGPFDQYWNITLMAISVATMTIGNLVALAQKNIKRLLAYSSIAHAGYILIGFVTLSSGLGMTSVIFYLMAYLFTNLAAFGVVTYYGRVVGSDEISAYAGMSRRSPALALVMLVAFLSLSGMPPLGGFVGKFLVFASAVDARVYWLAFVGVINAIIGLYYYLTVLKVVYLYRSDNDDQPVSLPRPYALGLGLLVVMIILIGTAFGPWYNWASAAAMALP